VEELEKFKERVRAASDVELKAITDAYQSTLAVLLMQARGVRALQEITVAEVTRRMDTRAAAGAAGFVPLRGDHGCN